MHATSTSSSLDLLRTAGILEAMRLAPGPRWLWIAAPVLVIGFIMWKSTALPAALACDDREVTQSLRRILALDSDDVPNAELTAKLSDIEQAGYASAFRSRGCRSRISMQRGGLPTAYTVAPKYGDDKQFQVAIASSAIVEARYGHIDEGGRFLHNAAPIGRAGLGRALRAGVGRLSVARSGPGMPP